MTIEFKPEIFGDTVPLGIKAKPGMEIPLRYRQNVFGRIKDVTMTARIMNDDAVMIRDLESGQWDTFNKEEINDRKIKSEGRGIAGSAARFTLLWKPTK